MTELNQGQHAQHALPPTSNCSQEQVSDLRADLEAAGMCFLIRQ